MASPRVIVIMNAGSGTGLEDATVAQVRETFQAASAAVEIAVPSGPGLGETAAQAVEAGFRTIVAAGGDGTISAVASKVAGTEAVLGVLPLGTLNHFAKDIGVPADLEGAVKTILAGRIASLDAAEVNGRIFINNSSLGLYPKMVSHREEHERTGRSRWFALSRACIACLKRFPFLDLELTVGGQKTRLKTPFLFIGNNVYTMEGVNLGTREKLSGGVLCVAVAHRTGRLGILRLAMNAFLGRLLAHKDFDMICAQDVHVASPRPRLRVAVDGEVLTMNTPLRYRIVPGALKVMVPAT